MKIFYITGTREIEDKNYNVVKKYLYVPQFTYHIYIKGIINTQKLHPPGYCIKYRLTTRITSKCDNDNNPRPSLPPNDIFRVDIYFPRERVNRENRERRPHNTQTYTTRNTHTQLTCSRIYTPYGGIHTLARTHPTEKDARARRSRSRDSGRAGRQRWVHLLQVRRYMHVVGIRALDWRRPASREGRDASQERTLILNRGRSCSERQFNERVFRGRITVVHPSGARPRETNRFRLSIIGRVTSRHVTSRSRARSSDL